MIMVSRWPGDQWVLAELCKGLFRGDRFAQVVARRQFNNRICHGELGRLVDAYFQSHNSRDSTGDDRDQAGFLVAEYHAPINLNEHIDPLVFPYKNALQTEPASSEKWNTAARNCIHSFIAQDEYIPKQTLLSGLSAVPYFLPVQVARRVVEHSQERGYLQTVEKSFVSLPSMAKKSSRWTRGEVASELQALVDATRHTDSWTATCLSAIRWNFTGNASLNDEMGLLVPIWCRLRKIRATRAATICSAVKLHEVSSLLAILDLLGESLQEFDKNILRADEDQQRRRGEKSFRHMNDFLLQWKQITKAQHGESDDAISSWKSLNDVSFLLEHGNPIRNAYTEYRASWDEESENTNTKAPPEYSRATGNWIFTAELAKRLGLETRTITDARKKHTKRTADSHDEFGAWGVHSYGTFRRKVGGTNFVAYFVGER
ncbi:hypothetical protein [Aureliella helgolandensis]|uniref:hypothetical protein n=1 Tax=Aureliella helgolandensis TaxID=2527968 RepID=UPI001E4006D1|nr:hypothetical protein [Aureliella helgolandensis]